MKKLFSLSLICLMQVACNNSQGFTEISKERLALSSLTPVVTKGSLVVSWAAPTQNEDNSTFTDVSFYKLYYGTSSGHYINAITVGNASSYALTGLDRNQTYFFAVSVVNSTGDESPKSPEQNSFLK
jgi:hypothetical protein